VKLNTLLNFPPYQHTELIFARQSPWLGVRLALGPGLESVQWWATVALGKAVGGVGVVARQSRILYIHILYNLFKHSFNWLLINLRYMAINPPVIHGSKPTLDT
jgi:hypothetical protein